MKPRITRRDILAAVVGAVVASLLAPIRFALLASDADRAPGVYVVERWTGRAWYIAGSTRYRVHDYQPQGR